MAYQMVAMAVTLNDLEGHSPVADVFTCNPSNICGAFYTISTDVARRAVPLQQQSLLLMEVGMEFHVAGELQLKARRPKSVDIYGKWRSWGLKNGEPVTAGVLKGDHRDKMADKLLRTYR